MANFVDEEIIKRKLGYQLSRLHQFLYPLSDDSDEAFACVAEAYSREKVEAAAQQALQGHVLPRETAVCCRCGNSLSAGERLQVRARRSFETLVWHLDAVACDSCKLGLAPRRTSIDIVASAQLLEIIEDSALRVGKISIVAASGTSYRRNTERPAESEGPDT